MMPLRFPSGERVDVVALPSISNGRTSLVDGSDGALLQPELARPLRPRFPAVSTDRLFRLADELGALVAIEQDCGEPWLEWAANVERQAVAELARRANRAGTSAT
jgi:hypothetical protein